MELTLNELKILRNALNKKLRDAHILSTEYSDIKKSLYKVNTEIERIDNEIRQKACNEAFRAISDILKPKKMKDFFKNSKTTDSKIELIEPNYEGIAKVLSEFEKLYKVCENKELLDKCLENFCSPKMFFNGDF